MRVEGDRAKDFYGEQVKNNTTGHEGECKGKRAWQTSEHDRKDDKNIR